MSSTITISRSDELFQVYQSSFGQAAFGQDQPELYEAVNYFMQSQGKCLRPVLLLIGCDVVGGEVSDALEAAWGIELFHNFTLVHDDIMDDSHQRRGRPTVHQKFDLTTAINAGDLLFAYAYKQLLKTKPEVLPQVLEAFNKTVVQIIEGQQLDLMFENREVVSEREYIKMITCKTAVLLGASLQMGGIIGGADYAVQKQLFGVGKNLGIAFQLKDDWLDTFGDETTFGKRIGGDILQDKKTYLHVKFWDRSDDEQKAVWNAAQEEEPEKKIATVTSLYEETGVRYESFNLMEEYFEKCLLHLEALPISEIQKLSLKSFVEQIFNRKK